MSLLSQKSAALASGTTGPGIGRGAKEIMGGGGSSSAASIMSSAGAAGGGAGTGLTSRDLPPLGTSQSSSFAFDGNSPYSFHTASSPGSVLSSSGITREELLGRESSASARAGVSAGYVDMTSRDDLVVLDALERRMLSQSPGLTIQVHPGVALTAHWNNGPDYEQMHIARRHGWYRPRRVFDNALLGGSAGAQGNANPADPPAEQGGRFHPSGWKGLVENVTNIVYDLLRLDEGNVAVAAASASLRSGTGGVVDLMDPPTVRQSYYKVAGANGFYELVSGDPTTEQDLAFVKKTASHDHALALTWSLTATADGPLLHWFPAVRLFPGVEEGLSRFDALGAEYGLWQCGSSLMGMPKALRPADAKKTLELYLSGGGASTASTATASGGAPAPGGGDRRVGSAKPKNVRATAIHQRTSPPNPRLAALDTVFAPRVMAERSSTRLQQLRQNAVSLCPRQKRKSTFVSTWGTSANHRPVLVLGPPALVPERPCVRAYVSWDQFVGHDKDTESFHRVVHPNKKCRRGGRTPFGSPPAGGGKGTCVSPSCPLNSAEERHQRGIGELRAPLLAVHLSTPSGSTATTPNKGRGRPGPPTSPAGSRSSVSSMFKNPTCPPLADAEPLFAPVDVSHLSPLAARDSAGRAVMSVHQAVDAFLKKRAGGGRFLVSFDFLVADEPGLGTLEEFSRTLADQLVAARDGVFSSARPIINTGAHQKSSSSSALTSVCAENDICPQKSLLYGGNSPFSHRLLLRPPTINAKTAGLVHLHCTRQRNGENDFDFPLNRADRRWFSRHFFPGAQCEHLHGRYPKISKTQVSFSDLLLCTSPAEIYALSRQASVLYARERKLDWDFESFWKSKVHLKRDVAADNGRLVRDLNWALSVEERFIQLAEAKVAEGLEEQYLAFSRLFSAFAECLWFAVSPTNVCAFSPRKFSYFLLGAVLGGGGQHLGRGTHTQEQGRRMMAEVGVGLSLLGCVLSNDSPVPIASRKRRHDFKFITAHAHGACGCRDRDCAWVLVGAGASTSMVSVVSRIIFWTLQREKRSVGYKIGRRGGKCD